MSRSNKIQILILLVFLQWSSAQDSSTFVMFSTSIGTDNTTDEVSTTEIALSTTTVINESTKENLSESNTTPATITTTSRPTTTTTRQSGDDSEDSDLALILGLSLGLGIPVVALLVGGTLYYFLIHRKKTRVNPTENPNETQPKSAANEIPLQPKSSGRPSSSKKTADS